MLINLEGIDGCGKSTQSQFLMEKFESDNEKTILLKEPTNGKYGQMLWNMLSGNIEATTEEILELFVLDRKARRLRFGYFDWRRFYIYLR